jgi:transglutaminase-like putative cysteine protease
MRSKPSFNRFLPTKLAAVLPLLVLFLAPMAVAGTPDWLRSLAGQPLPKYPDNTNAVIVLDEQLTSVDHEGEIKTLYRRAYRILRPEGRKYGVFAVYFDQETRLTYLKGWSISAQGTEYEVKEKDAVETSPFDEALYLDTRLKVLTIPATEPGSLIGYEYEQRRRPFVLQDMWRFQGELPVRHTRFVLRLPELWEYHVHFLNHAEADPQASGTHQWTWDLQDVPPMAKEASMPAWRGLAGRLAVTYFPAKALSHGNSYRSWQDVGLWYAHLTAPSRQLTPEISQKVVELTANRPAQLDKLRALATFVQRDIRYVAVEIGIGGYQPHPAGTVLTNRYGDCKDKATLLATMLQQIGVDSYYVLTHSDRGVIAPDFPSALNFNHAILAIRLPKDANSADFSAAWPHPRLGRLLIFDPTDEYTPIGYMPAQEQGNRGLLVTDGGGELVDLPLLQASTNRLQRSGRLTLDSHGALSGEVKEIRSGYVAAQYRSMLLNASPRERDKMLESFLGKFINGVQITRVATENLEQIDKDLIVSYTFNAAQYGRSAGNLLVVRPRVIGEKSNDVLEGEPRTQPFEFPALTLDTDEFELTLPPGYRLDGLPKPVHASFPFAEYQSGVENRENSLRYTRSYQIKDVTVQQQQLPDLKAFFRQIAAEERVMVVLKRTDQ